MYSGSAFNDVTLDCFVINVFCPSQVGLIETNGELKVFIDQNLSPSKGISQCLYATQYFVDTTYRLLQLIVNHTKLVFCVFRCRPMWWKVDNRGHWRFNQELYSLLVFSFLRLGVLSLVTVQPTTVPVAKQLLPKTLGPSNVNVAAHMQHIPHMVSDGPHSYNIVTYSII